jgi:hypothetical protein
MAQHTRRREVLALGAGFAASTALGAIGFGKRSQAGEVPKHPQAGAPRPGDFTLPAGGKMPTRKLGRTGVEVSLLGLGGFHIGLPKEEKTATRIVRTAVDHGVTFLDNCWDYNDGKSQVWMGRALRDGYRQRPPFAARTVTPTDCLHYSMSLPTSVVITGCDTLGVLMQGIDAAYRWKPMTEPDKKSLLARTAPVAGAGKWEKYKTAGVFDGTNQHPWWLETASLKG